MKTALDLAKLTLEIIRDRGFALIHHNQSLDLQQINPPRCQLDVIDQPLQNAIAKLGPQIKELLAQDPKKFFPKPCKTTCQTPPAPKAKQSAACPLDSKHVQWLGFLMGQLHLVPNVDFLDAHDQWINLHTRASDLFEQLARLDLDNQAQVSTFAQDLSQFYYSVQTSSTSARPLDPFDPNPLYEIDLPEIDDF